MVRSAAGSSRSHRPAAQYADHRCATVPGPGPHVRDHSRLGLALGQRGTRTPGRGEHGFLPGCLQPVQIRKPLVVDSLDGLGAITAVIDADLAFATIAPRAWPGIACLRGALVATLTIPGGEPVSQSG